MASKRIILLLDGTWNDQDVGLADTNIVRMQQLIAKSLAKASPPLAKVALSADKSQKIVRGFTTEGERENIVFYERGVGTGAFDRFRGGIFGDGLDGNVRRAYKFLSYWYQRGDQVFIFGFSRGAYTARSLVGYVASAGLLKRESCTAANEALAWGFYRTPPEDRLPGIWAELGPHVQDRDTFHIDCIGVFETVGALGIPSSAFDIANRDWFSFHNVELSSITRVNLHALAIDEHREPFQAAVWRKPKFKQFASHTEQVWFAGAHADIGGSYIKEETRATAHPLSLDDITLDWIIKRLNHYFHDFPLNRAEWKTVDDSWATAQQHEPRKLFYRLEPFSLRSIANYPVTDLEFFQRNVSRDRHSDPIGEMVHVSALERIGISVQTEKKIGRYAPKNLIQVLGIIDETYSQEIGTRELSGPDIHIVDWSGAELDPAQPGHQNRVQTIVSSARQRLSTD